MVLWLIYVIVVSAISGHVAYGATGGHPENARIIFHTVGLTTLLAYAGALWPQTIWFRKPGATSAKGTLDALIYAVATGFIFVYFWPR
jgi:hypothetical protein